MAKKGYFTDGGKYKGVRPWGHTDHGRGLTEDEAKSVVDIYNSYVRQWNDIELDRNRNLDEHRATYESMGFTISVGDDNIIVMHCPLREWTAEIYTKKFDVFHPGWSTGKNTLPTKKVKRVMVHFKGTDDKFNEWLLLSKLTWAGI